MNKIFLVITAVIIMANFLGAQVFAQSWTELPIEGKRLKALRDESGAVLNGRHRSTITLVNGEKLTAEVAYADGFENGLMTVTDQSNAARYEIPFEKGAVNGLVKGFGTAKYPGYIWEAQYFNGKKHGFGRKYDEKRVLYFDASYENGYEHGPKKEFYSTGHLYREVNMVYGRPEGSRRSYSPDGSLEEEEYYEKGIMKKRNYYR